VIKWTLEVSKAPY